MSTLTCVPTAHTVDTKAFLLILRPLTKLKKKMGNTASALTSKTARLNFTSSQKDSEKLIFAVTAS